MNKMFDFLTDHGLAVVFITVFAEQLGLPLPAVPWLMVAGALVVQGKMNWLLLIAVAFIASLLADLIWFYLGRHYGNRILGFMCRVSLEPDFCVSRTQGLFERYGLRGIVFAKFIPGLSTIAPPLAGGSGMGIGRFAFFDGAGAILHSGLFILLGALFSRELVQVMNALDGLGRQALLVVLGLAAAWIGYKYYERQRLLRELRMTRITVDELYQKQQAGENLVILDLRPEGELTEDSTMIRGARHMIMNDVALRRNEIPEDREIVLYCSCPNEVTSARVTLHLKRHGIGRVRPLLGGIDAWRARNFPTDKRSAGTSSA